MVIGISVDGSRNGISSRSQPTGPRSAAFFACGASNTPFWKPKKTGSSKKNPLLYQATNSKSCGSSGITGWVVGNSGTSAPGTGNGEGSITGTAAV